MISIAKSYLPHKTSLVSCRSKAMFSRWSFTSRSKNYLQAVLNPNTKKSQRIYYLNVSFVSLPSIVLLYTCTRNLGCCWTFECNILYLFLVWRNHFLIEHHRKPLMISILGIYFKFCLVRIFIKEMYFHVIFYRNILIDFTILISIHHL